jgi:hypothetical protein
MDQYLSLFTGKRASGTAEEKFDAVGALMMDSPSEWDSHTEKEERCYTG